MHITSVARLRLDTTHGTTDWKEQNRRMHNNSWITILPFWCGLHRPPCTNLSKIRHIFKTPKILPKWLLCFQPLHHHSHRCFRVYIYITLTHFTIIFLIPWHLRIFQNIHHHQHGDCRILANGTWIWHLECSHHVTSVLGRRPQLDHPRHSFRMCLHPLLLDFAQPHPMPVIQRSSIWMFCSSTECSIYPTAVFSQWRLWEWFQQWLTNTSVENTMHTPHFQYGTHILWSSPHYAILPSWYTTLLHTACLTQTSASLPDVSFWLKRVIRIQTDHQTVTKIQTPHQTTPQMKRKTSKWYLLMMSIGQQKWYQKECFVYMKMDYPIMYVNTHAFMGILITLSHIWTA